MSNITHRSKIKSQFFDGQIKFITNMNTMLTSCQQDIKKCFSSSEQQIYKKLQCTNKKIQQAISILKSDIKCTKIQSMMELDSQKIQQEQFSRKYDSKIEQLNEKLVLSQGHVQQAENIKKYWDRQGKNYQVTKQKVFKNVRQTRPINNYIYLFDNVFMQLLRSIKLVTKLEEAIEKSYGLDHKIFTIARLKKQGIKRQKYSQLIKQKRSYSEQKYALSASPLKPLNHHNLSTFTIFTTHPSYKLYFTQNLQKIIKKLKNQNQINQIRNKYLNDAITEKNKAEVLKHLKNKHQEMRKNINNKNKDLEETKNQQQLNFQESIAIVELQAQLLNKFIDERMFALVSKKYMKGPIKNGRNRKSEEKIQRKQRVRLSSLNKKQQSNPQSFLKNLENNRINNPAKIKKQQQKKSDNLQKIQWE